MVGKEADTASELKIQEEVKTIWRKFMSEGLPEKAKTTIIENYPREGNLYAQAPEINREIQPVLTEKKSDQHFINTQNSAGMAIVALMAAVSMIDQPEDGIDYTQFASYICDAGKLLADIFYQQSMTRRSFITLLLSKSVKPTVEATKPDEKWLYGQQFVKRGKGCRKNMFTNKGN